MINVHPLSLSLSASLTHTNTFFGFALQNAQTSTSPDFSNCGGICSHSILLPTPRHWIQPGPCPQSNPEVASALNLKNTFLNSPSTSHCKLTFAEQRAEPNVYEYVFRSHLGHLVSDLGKLWSWANQEAWGRLSQVDSWRSRVCDRTTSKSCQHTLF